MAFTKSQGISSLPQHHVWLRSSERIELWHFGKDSDQSRDRFGQTPKPQQWVRFWSPPLISASLVAVDRTKGFLNCSCQPLGTSRSTWSDNSPANGHLSCYHENSRCGVLKCSPGLEHCVVLGIFRKNLVDGIPKKLMFLKDTDLIRPMLLEWRESIDACCEVPAMKISNVHYPPLTYGLKYLPSYIIHMFAVSSPEQGRKKIL